MSFSALLAAIQSAPLLLADEEKLLLKTRNEKASRERLVQSHLRLVLRIAKGFLGYGHPLEDLISIGTTGLLKAIDRFDSDHAAGSRLAHYASFWIKSALQEYCLAQHSMVKLGTTPVQKRLFFGVRRVMSELGILDESRLTDQQAAQIAETLQVTPEEVSEVVGRLGAARSLDAPVSADNQDGGNWVDYLADESIVPADVALSDAQEHSARMTLVNERIGQLTDREQDILRRRILGDPPVTLDALATDHGISRERVRQIAEQILWRLRGRVGTSPSGQGYASTRLRMKLAA